MRTQPPGLDEGLIGSPEVMYIASQTIAVPQVGKRTFEKPEQRERFDETASRVFQRPRRGDAHWPRPCCGRRGRHAGAPLGQERVQFRGNAVGSAAAAEFEPTSG